MLTLASIDQMGCACPASPREMLGDAVAVPTEMFGVAPESGFEAWKIIVPTMAFVGVASIASGVFIATRHRRADSSRRRRRR